MLSAALPESLIQFAWKHLYFELSSLRTHDGARLQIQDPGQLNTDQGPDFSAAQLEIDGIQWHGQVEIHVSSQTWYTHKHHLDPGYNAVILHVVYESNGKPIYRENGTQIPELILKDRISLPLLQTYSHIILSQDPLPCTQFWPVTNEIDLEAWLSQLASERISQKAHQILDRLKLLTQNWEQVLWEAVAAYFGGPVNGEAFRHMAQQLPYRILTQYTSSSKSLEALLFGGSGCLRTTHHSDTYYQDLQREWQFLRTKHRLEHLAPVNLKFLRMRPASFPTLRLAQLAQVLHQFPSLIDFTHPEVLNQFLQAKIHPSIYWETHYRFFEAHSPKSKALGKAHKLNLLINTFLPITFLFREAQGDTQEQSVCLHQLAGLPPEHNKITRLFEELGFKPKTALHSQALIQLKKAYCDQKNCLACGIGSHLLKAPT